MPTTTTLFFCTLIFFLCIKCKRQRDFKLAKAANNAKRYLIQNNVKLMPTPPSLPLLGHIHLLRDYQHNPWAGFQQIRKQFGNVVSLKMGIHQMVLVSSNDAMREILLEKGHIFSNRPEFSRHHTIFGGDKENSLALCNWSNTHRFRRKLCKRGIIPNKFSARNQLLEETVSHFVLEFIHNLTINQLPQTLDHPTKSPPYETTHCASQQQQQQVTSATKPTSSLLEESTLESTNQTTKKSDITNLDNQQQYFIATKEHILLLTSDIFMRFLCNESGSHLDPEYRRFAFGCDFVFWDINQMYLIDFLPFLTCLGIGFTYLKNLKKETDFLRGYIDDNIFDPRMKKIAERHASLDKFEKFEMTFDTESESTDYLNSLILEYINRETSMSIADYKVGFADILAGHAAVANILYRLLGHLALDRKTQDMICEEANQADLHNLTHRPSLPVTEAALQEALRLASSPIVPHVATEDTSVDQFHIPHGTIVLFNNYNLNLSDTLWTDPFSFDPTRFLTTSACSSDTSARKRYKLDIPKHFIPFSVGLRQCLGYKMVETTTIVMVANLCRRFVIGADNEELVRHLLAPKGSIALNPDSECYQLKLCTR